jgi:hypothetical protein
MTATATINSIRVNPLPFIATLRPLRPCEV